MSLLPDDRGPWAGGALSVTTTDYHTGGEPFRIVTGGVPDIPGATILERRRHAAEQLDHVRQLLVNEPRGHADMYGGLVVPPDDDEADLGVLFFHNEGYSSACGHGTIALATWAVEEGVVTATPPLTRLTIDVPSGRLHVQVHMPNGEVEQVSFINVPSFVEAHVDLAVEGPGPIDPDADDAPVVSADIAFGGAFYAIIQAADLGLRVHADDLGQIVSRCRAIKDALNAAHEFVHPDTPELAGIYGVILVDEVSDVDGTLHQRNVTVFADGEVDRSATGSGTSARLALLHHQGRLGDGRVLHNESIVGSHMTGRVLGETVVGGRPAITTEVSGSAHLSGRHEFVLDPRDPLGTGFLLR